MLETAARCLAGTVAIGLSACAVRLGSKHVSRDVVLISVSSAFCLCGAAATAAAYTDNLLEVDARMSEQHDLNPGEHGNSDLEGLKTLIVELWPHIRAAAKQLKDGVIEPMVQKSVPSLHFKEFDLGEHAPEISVRTVDSHGPNRGIMLQIGVAWTSNSKISMVVGSAIPFGVRSMAITGTLYVVMQPITLEPPVIGAMQVYFIDKPEVLLHYTGAAALARMPGLEQSVQRAIDDCIASMVVLPNRISFPIAANLDMADLNSPPPIGILWIRPVRAVNIRAADRNLLSANSSDPYVVFMLGKQRYRSKTISTTLNPAWEKEGGMWCAWCRQRTSIRLSSSSHN